MTESLISSYYGHLLSYNEGLYHGNGTLIAALWRNVLQGRENVTAVQLEILQQYVHKQLEMLEVLEGMEGLKFTPQAPYK